MVPGFRVAAAAVEAEAGPDLRELSVDDWDSALAEAGDTLVVVDFYTNWYVAQLGLSLYHTRPFAIAVHFLFRPCSPHAAAILCCEHCTYWCLHPPAARPASIFPLLHTARLPASRFCMHLVFQWVYPSGQLTESSNCKALSFALQVWPLQGDATTVGAAATGAV